MRVYQRLTPLTQEEKQHAADSYHVIEWFFSITGYDREDCYDAAVTGYLKAVKSWCSREELHRYSFATIAKQMMRSYIGNERRKNDRRIRTLSLDAPLGESGGFALIDTITYDNYLNHYEVCREAEWEYQRAQ